MAQAYRCRPSELLDIEDDPLTALYFDRAAYVWGTRVEQAIEEAQNAKTEQGKRQKLAIAQSKWLGINKFANPGQMRQRQRT